LAAIARSAKQPRAAVSLERLTAATTSPRQASWRVAIDASALTQRPPATHLFVAITEDGLASSVARGENAGRTLRHVAVVRSLRTLGRVWLDQAGRATQDFTIELETSWQPERLQVVAWVADGPAGHVLGARRAAL
jgi:hypothetical protein